MITNEGFTGGTTAVAEPINITATGKAQCLRATYYKDGIRNMVGNDVDKRTCVAEPVIVGSNTGAYAVPYDVEELSEDYYHGDKDGNVLGKIVCKNTSNNNGQPAQGTRVYKTDNKSVCLDADSRKYVVAKAPGAGWVVGKNGKNVPVYEVKDGQITIKGKQYPIKLADGFYIIRKLTVRECKRLQTVPEWYVFPVSDSQSYKLLGNGWTVLVIAHLIIATQYVDKEEC